MKLYHCRDARSLRPLWVLEELALEYELVNLAFPPRVKHKDFLEINPLGTVPVFIEKESENENVLTESVAICQYLADKYGSGALTIKPSDKEYGQYLNWLHRSDATYTFPQTLVLRYQRFEPQERLQPQVVEDYKKWFYSRLRSLEAHLAHNDYLCANTFTIADICVSYALFLAQALKIDQPIGKNCKEYLARLSQRKAFKSALAKQSELELSF